VIFAGAQFLRRRTLTSLLAQGLINGWRDGTAPPAVVEDARLSFEELYERHFSFTWRALRHLGVPPATLEDAAQEVWMVVHQRLPSFEGRSEPRTWLFGIAMNVARNRRRGQRRSPEMQPLSEQVVSARPDPEVVRAGQEAWNKIQSFLQTLDERRCAVFVFSLLEQMSAAETAEATGLDPATVYHLVRGLRRSFKAYLAEFDGAER
jgi:RNA polymerase sigma-70 factor (ECF subfamily)